MNWFNLIVQLLPTILQLVVAVENAIPNADGTAKKTVVIGGINTATGGTVPQKPLGDVIDGFVNVLNSTGIFTTTKPKT